MLALSGALAAGFAGCGGGGGGDGETTTPEDGGGGTTTTEETTRTTIPITESGGSFAEPFGATSPSSNIAPLDGWASAEWLTEIDLRVAKVTNLNKSGEGSLKAALEMDDPRVIVFEVGGVIDMEGENLNVLRPNCFVAGQTAPSPGITIIKGGLDISASNVLIQHIRVRPGDEAFEATDGINAGSGQSNIIVDHCSVSWAIDENLSAGGGLRQIDVTMSNNLIAECLFDSIHPKGPHSKGTLLMNKASNVAVLGNVYAHHNQRTPRLKGGTSSAVANNLSYNFNAAIMVGGGPGDKRGGAMSSSIESNQFWAGPVTETDRPIVYPRDDAVGPKVHLANNVTDPDSMPMHEGFEPKSERPLWPEGFETFDVSEVAEHNFAAAGARPADRTSQDQRIVEQVQNREGDLIDSQSEVGGYPDLESTERTLDVPQLSDGFVQWIRQHTKAVELEGESPP